MDTFAIRAIGQVESRSLSFINRQIMQVLNLCLMFAFLVFAYVSFFHTSELIHTSLGRSMLLLISMFWVLRGIQQVLFFGTGQTQSIAFIMLFIAGAGCYAHPWLKAIEGTIR